MGMCPVKDEDKADMPKPPTLEDLIYEIAGEAACEAMENR